MAAPSSPILLNGNGEGQKHSDNEPVSLAKADAERTTSQSSLLTENGLSGNGSSSGSDLLPPSAFDNPTLAQLHEQPEGTSSGTLQAGLSAIAEMLQQQQQTQQQPDLSSVPSHTMHSDILPPSSSASNVPLTEPQNPADAPRTRAPSASTTSDQPTSFLSSNNEPAHNIQLQPTEAQTQMEMAQQMFFGQSTGGALFSSSLGSMQAALMRDLNMPISPDSQQHSDSPLSSYLGMGHVVSASSIPPPSGHIGAQPTLPANIHTVQAFQAALPQPVVLNPSQAQLYLPPQTRTPTYVDITEYLNIPQSEASRRLGVPTSTLSKRWKEVARDRKWPFRTVAKLDKEIATLLHNVPSKDHIPEEIKAQLAILLKKRKNELKPVTIRI